MKTLQIAAYGAPLVLAETPKPVAQGREVVVRVAHCGMCHSDLHIHSGGFTIGGGQVQSIAGSHALPFTLGHEIEGVVDDVGAEAVLPEGMAVGSRVAVYPWIGCGQCAACGRGEENLCEAQQALGIQVDGGYAEYVKVPEGRYLLPAEGLAAGQAGLLMCSGLTAFAALQRLRVAAGDAWLLIGAGGVGLTALGLAQAMGLPAPHVADSNPAAREAALAAGAASAVAPEDASLQGMGFAATLDFVGTEATVGLSLRVLCKGGAAVVVGLYGGLLMLPVLQVPVRQLRIEGSLTGTLEQARALLELVRKAGLAPITHQHRRLEDGAAAMEDLRERRIVGRIVLGA
jgi:D-arabinose 1-dehydrogenase-like Zn-dependent alcohol dehydrogenase